MTAINLEQKLAAFSEHWQPRVVGPVAEEEAHLLLIEPRGTPNTGDAATAAPRREI